MIFDYKLKVDLQLLEITYNKFLNYVEYETNIIINNGLDHFHSIDLEGEFYYLFMKNEFNEDELTNLIFKDNI